MNSFQAYTIATAPAASKPTFEVMSDYTNHIVHTLYDAFMESDEWTKPEHVPGTPSAA